MALSCTMHPFALHETSPPHASFRGHARALLVPASRRKAGRGLLRRISASLETGSHNKSRCFSVKPVLSTPRSSSRVHIFSKGERGPVVGTLEDLETTFKITLDSAEARKSILLEQITLDKGFADIYVGGVALYCLAQEVGVIPGMVLKSMSHPTRKGETWDLTGTENLRYVKDGINTTQYATITMEFEKEPTITAEMVAAFSGDEVAGTGETEGTDAPPVYAPVNMEDTPVVKVVRESAVDRKDLYSDNWEGDQYTGSGWNNLTVILAIALVTIVGGVIFAIASKGTLWGTSGYY